MKKNFILFVFICFASFLSIAETFTGKVIVVTDGDTIQVLRNNNAEKIRLDGIDCPESGQDYGTKAKQFTSDLCFGKIVSINTKEKDRYGRTVATVILPDNRILNEELVRNGLAWWYKKYSPNNVTLETLQEEAKSKKIGLWSKENPIAPWDFRKGNVSSAGNNENYKTDTTQPKGLVYITQTGKKYHNKGCRYLSKSQIPILLKDALQQRYEPCSVCNPPSKVEEIAPVYIPSTAGRAPPLPVDSQKTTESYSPPSFNNGSSYNSIPPTTNVQVQQQVADIQVFITNTGKKYHKDGCRYLSKSKIPINKNAAISRGYGACSVCRP